MKASFLGFHIKIITNKARFGHFLSHLSLFSFICGSFSSDLFHSSSQFVSIWFYLDAIYRGMGPSAHISLNNALFISFSSFKFYFNAIFRIKLQKSLLRCAFFPFSASFAHYLALMSPQMAIQGHLLADCWEPMVPKPSFSFYFWCSDVNCPASPEILRQRSCRTDHYW